MTSQAGRRVPASMPFACLAAVLLWCCGCLWPQALPSQAPVLEEIEPRTGRPYLLYVPSTYRDGLSWPLVVACHGTWPWDIPQRQMREWAQFGEDHGILVAAPTLNCAKGDFPHAPDRQIAVQQEDEEAVLAMVSAVKRRYRVAEDKVFMTGWSAGAYAILHIGLRNPDVFRALAIRQGTFDERFMAVPDERLDPWQRILVIYGMADFLRDHSKEMIEWLRGRGMTVDEREIAGSHRRIDPKLPWRFFRDVIRKTPWVRIRAQGTDPMEPRRIQFHVDAEPPAVRQKWFFGDGNESYESAPTHEYAQASRYDVTVNVELEGGKKYSRKRSIDVR